MAPRDSPSQRPVMPGGENADGVVFRAVDRTSEPGAAESAPPEQQVGVSVLARILDLENTDVGPVPAPTGRHVKADIFRGFNLAEGTFLPTRVFGGQLIGQGLVAASRTVDSNQPVHSLHCYFLRPGTPKAPFVYVVDRTRDGKSFSTRTVTAQQKGEAIFRMTCSFHSPEKGSFTHAVPMPADVPTPEGLPTQGERLHKAGSNPRLPPDVRTALVHRADTPFPLDFRQVVGSSSSSGGASVAGVGASRTLAWFRCPTRLPDDPALHRCVAAYGSDLALLETALVPHRKPGQKGRLTRHMVRFCAPVCAGMPHRRFADLLPACGFSTSGVH
jgi:acyl-CoA thioesterase II